MAFLCLALAAGSLAPLVAVAEPEAADRHAFEKELAFGGDGESAPADARPASAWGTVGSFAGYAIVLVLLVAGLIVLSKKIVPGARRFGASDAIQILGRRNLTPQASLFLVQVGRRVLRVGVAKDALTFMGEVADADEVALIRGQCLGTNEASAFKEAMAAQAVPERKTRVEAPAEEEPQTVEEESPVREETAAPPAEVSVKNELDAIRKVVNGWRASA
ncbi:MAG: flagellar biosynthetic protein FliO [Planctomycetota bacterium]